MSCPQEYWIWLQRTLGAGFFADELLAYFGDARGVYEAGHDQLLRSGTITPKAVGRLSAFSPSQSYDVIKNCEENGWHIVTCDSEFYPERLKAINSFPLVLYVWGDPQALSHELSISMVGTRDCSDYGLEIAGSIAYSLAKSGFCIVSGGAVGVDRACHEGAMDAGGRTVAFLGCGLGYDYLKCNGNMRRKIAKCGAVVSEFIPYSPPSRITFPIRNRLISGLSLGTVVIEAGEKSGSLITARNALDQGRDVFAVPGDISSSNYFGTNRLIRDGAKAVSSIYDILIEYSDIYPDIDLTGSDAPIVRYSKMNENAVDPKPDTTQHKRKRSSSASHSNDVGIQSGQLTMTDAAKPAAPDYITDEAKKVYSYLTGEALHVDYISAGCKMSVQDTLTALTELEMLGLCRAHSGGRYSI